MCVYNGLRFPYQFYDVVFSDTHAHIFPKSWANYTQTVSYKVENVAEREKKKFVGWIWSFVMAVYFV